MKTDFWEITVKMYYNGSKKEKKRKIVLFVEYGVAKHSFGALMEKTVPKTRG